MSSAASALRTPTRGYAQIPNSIIENASALTHAELLLALIVCRRSGDKSACPVTDSTWEKWTGLKARMKEAATAGLRKKGLHVDGRGDRARYLFETHEWAAFVSAGAPVRPRTAGRRPVDPKPGAKIHPECRERGCALLAAQNRVPNDGWLETGDIGLKLIKSSPIAQPVAQTYNTPTVDQSQPETLASTAVGQETNRAPIPARYESSALFAVPIAQPVAQTHKFAWPETMRALKQFFPLVGVAFVLRLVSRVQGHFNGVNDGELAAAVVKAAMAKRDRQKTEGLFLFTVPEALLALRELPAAAGPSGGRQLDTEILIGRLKACSSTYRAREGYAVVADELDFVLAEGAQMDGADMLAWLDDQLQRIEIRAFSVADEQLSDEQRANVQAFAGAERRRYANQGATKAALDELWSRLVVVETFRLLALPRVGMF